MVTQNSVRRLLEVCPQSNLVGHGPGRDEESRFLASDFGHMGFQGLSARLVIDVVADGSPRGVKVHILSGHCICRKKCDSARRREFH